MDRPADRSSFLLQRTKAVSSLRHSRRATALSRQRASSPPPAPALLPPDVPLSVSLPLLQTDTYNALRQVRFHLERTQYNDAALVFPHLPLLFRFLTQDEHVAFETLVILTNLVTVSSAYNAAFFQMDHRPVISVLLVHPNNHLRSQAAWYLSNFISDGMMVSVFLMNAGVVTSCVVGIQRYPDDLEYINHVAYVFNNLCRSFCVYTDEHQTPPTTTPSQTDPQAVTFFQTILPLYAQLLPFMDRALAVVWGIVYLVEERFVLKRLLRSTPTLVERVVALLRSRKKRLVLGALAFLQTLSEQKPKYSGLIVRHAEFFEETSRMARSSTPTNTATLCFIASNLVLVDPKVVELFLRSNFIQRVVVRVLELQLEEDKNWSDTAIELGWLLCNSLIVGSDECVQVMTYREVFLALGLCLELSAAEDFIAKILAGLTRIFECGQGMLGEVSVTDMFYDTKLYDKLSMISFAGGENASAANTLTFQIDDASTQAGMEM